MRFDKGNCRKKRVFSQPDVPRLSVRAGLLPGIVLLKTNISRIRNLSTEDDFPAWRIAAVIARF